MCIRDRNEDGSFTYNPNAGFEGTDSFTYVAVDGSTNSAIIQVSITVNPESVAPVPAGFPVVSFIEPQDGATILLGSLTSAEVDAIDLDGSIENVRLSINGDFVRQENIFPYEWGQLPADDVLDNLPVGTHQLTAVAQDNDGQSTAETITITCLLYTSPSPRDRTRSRMPSSA